MEHIINSSKPHLEILRPEVENDFEPRGASLIARHVGTGELGFLSSFPNIHSFSKMSYPPPGYTSSVRQSSSSTGYQALPNNDDLEQNFTSASSIKYTVVRSILYVKQSDVKDVRSLGELI